MGLLTLAWSYRGPSPFRSIMLAHPGAPELPSLELRMLAAASRVVNSVSITSTLGVMSLRISIVLLYSFVRNQHPVGDSVPGRGLKFQILAGCSRFLWRTLAVQIFAHPLVALYDPEADCGHPSLSRRPGVHG